MPKTLWTIAAVGLLTVGGAGCVRGGGPGIAGQGGAGGSGGSTGSGNGGNTSGGNGGGGGNSVGSGNGGSTGSDHGGSTGAGGGGASGSGNGGASGSGNGGVSGSGNGGASGGGNGGASGGGSGGSAGGGKGGSTGGGTGGSTASGTGGSIGGQTGATGGTTSSGSGDPEVMTSAENAYWKTGQVTKVTGGIADVDVNVDTDTTYQGWDGFGGCFNEMGWDALSAVTSADVANAMKLLFDPKDGANFLYGRLPMGASDYSMSWYTLDDLPSGTANDYTMDKFSIDRDRQKLIPFIKEALKARSDIHLWASPWVVPSWMMDSSSNMKSDAQTLGAHALYMARFVEEYAKEGLKIEAIHPQNEPGYGKVHWTQANLITFMKTYLGPKLAERTPTTQVWCGTMSKADNGGYDQAIALATAADADAMKYVKGFGVQWNLHDAVATLAASGVPVMQTEHRCGNYSFDSPYWDKSRYSSSKAQNDHLYGEESWQIIRDWIVSGVNSYSAWNMVLDTVGKSLDNWPQNALLVVDRSAKKLIVTPAYYVFRHFSYYIGVGATRVDATAGSDAYKGANTTKYGAGKATYDGVNAFAFKNPDGAVIVQVYNKASASTKTTVGVGSALFQTLYQFDVPAHGWATLRVP